MEAVPSASEVAVKWVKPVASKNHGVFRRAVDLQTSKGKNGRVFIEIDACTSFNGKVAKRINQNRIINHNGPVGSPNGITRQNFPIVKNRILAISSQLHFARFGTRSKNNGVGYQKGGVGGGGVDGYFYKEIQAVVGPQLYPL
jgi:hypothetical protein